MPRIDQLYITRFAVAMSVVIFHYGRKAFPFDTYPFDALFGSAPITYFFVLSGFVMMLVYYRPEEKFNTGQFWFNRMARIYPVYLASLVSVLALSPGLLRDQAGTLLNLTLLQGWVSPYPATYNFPAWALSVEIFLYAIFPVIIFFAYRIPFRWLVILVGVFWILDQAAHTYLLNTIYTGVPSLSHDLLFYNPLVHVNSFLVGCVGGIWFVKDPKRQILSMANNLCLIISLLLISLALLYFKDLPKLAGWNFKISLHNGSQAPLYMAFILFLSLDTTRFSKFLAGRWLVLLGEASYCIYIFQFPVHTLYKRLVEPHFLFLSNTWHFGLYSALLILISIIIFLLVEEPVRYGLRKIVGRVPLARQSP
jgi:peptidoglycan/LPS O-acetylase OafA/YrhL